MEGALLGAVSTPPVTRRHCGPAQPLVGHGPRPQAAPVREPPLVGEALSAMSAGGQWSGGEKERAVRGWPRPSPRAFGPACELGAKEKAGAMCPGLQRPHQGHPPAGPRWGTASSPHRCGPGCSLGDLGPTSQAAWGACGAWLPQRYPRGRAWWPGPEGAACLCLASSGTSEGQAVPRDLALFCQKNTR